MSIEPAWNPSEESTELLEARAGAVALLRLHRPAVRNALSTEVMVALTSALERLDRDGAVHVVVLTGGDRFFAAGADIASMIDASAAEMATRPQLGCWQRLRQFRKPLIAAVNGFALGGGAELVWVCDLVVAGESARFGQPEIALGIMPGGGATQRLPRAIGKAQSMELILLGEPISSWDAHELGLVNRVVPDELVLTAALRLAQQIAAKSLDATIAAKSAVLSAFDLPMAAGSNAERAAFNALFDSAGAREGMTAFLEKRKPVFGRKPS
ncbi:MAG TPA: enoyl-CoA hydratase-related protein [Thermomicrobiales bacterium]|nr:enoyl-CoA hydratase-related protein [Thermomicrobiales bacterium]